MIDSITSPERQAVNTPLDDSAAGSWPSAFAICLRFGWPVLGLVLALAAPAFGGRVFLAVAMLAVMPMNTCYQVYRLGIRMPPSAQRGRAVVLVAIVGDTLSLIIVAVMALVGACFLSFRSYLATGYTVP